MMNNLKKWLPLGLAVAVVVLGYTTYTFYSQLIDLKQDPQKASQEIANKLVERVGQLIILPTDETPTVATVSDPERLKDQPFFANAQMGDKVLIYTNAKKAFLYNPATNRIVEVAPINIGPTANTPAPKK